MSSDIFNNEYVSDFEDSKLDNTQETLINNNLENLNLEETSDIIDIPINESVDEPTFTLEDNQQKGKTSSSVWKFMYKKYNDEGKFIAIVCNLCKKEYETKTSTSPLKEHLIKEHKHNVIIKQQTKLNFIKKPYDKDDVIRIKDYNDALLNLVIGYQLPFAIVNNKWFDEFCKTMDLRFTLPF
ncbi:1815_t:CDS:1 [Diversispora eburnea]|uniref:1815_t:CDS:1 n=1 Tax=Diversispora eburnea TaxID=1213867 RepID=A0A9N9GX12_9GLOM|nr:1815_t:CDS:1 [Diversispora eburnea]